MHPGFLTLPLTPYNLVPPSGLVLKPLNQSGPLFTICGMFAIVSALFTIVGLPKSPQTWGKGGFALGVARFPSRAFKSAVSSPQI